MKKIKAVTKISVYKLELILLKCPYYLKVQCKHRQSLVVFLKQLEKQCKIHMEAQKTLNS